MSVTKNPELDVIFNKVGVFRANRRTKVGTFSEVEPGSLLKDQSDNRDNTGWPSGQHVVVNSPIAPEALQTTLLNWVNLTSKDAQQPSTQSLYVPCGGGNFQLYNAQGTPIGIPTTIAELIGANLGPDFASYMGFIAAIRTKPFILLAGISGTGKSRMVRQLARGCCPKWADAAKTVPHPFVDEQKPGNFEIIPVRPNWHDSTELMGYESRIGGAEFVIKPFVEFLIKAWMNPDIPFFLCLDEMNLAPVEQYFAEYLSAIESRKSVTGGGRTFFKTDVLVKMGAPETAWNDVGTTVLDKALKKLFESYKKADGALDAWPTYVREMFVKDGGVSIPPNLVVMGTVNMDETTCSFSRKVLDRAMSFELNDVSDMYDKNNLAAEKDLDFGCLGQTVTKCTMLTGAEAYAADNANGDKILKYLETVNKSLEGTPFKIAYRSRNEIMVYCVERTKGGVSLKSALDAATSMKILSRIEGDDQRFARFRLKEFRKTVVLALLKIDNDAAADADVTAFINDGEQVAASPSISKLTHMIEELEAGAGFVSYWE